jgi:hypothetical protein
MDGSRQSGWLSKLKSSTEPGEREERRGMRKKSERKGGVDEGNRVLY